ncbi:MAG TPA: hypothetical protein VM888_00495, partial [Chitinophagaceae bacterium]|nr:hypothetical protein [Chitinophagaceae bacterium]
TDGSFTYKPAATFTVGVVTFTYMISDNGYEAKTATASVTINYTIAAPLPVKLVSFAGTMNNNKVQLTWSADDNETGNYFEVEKSGGDNKFKTIALISTTKKVGTENYTYNEVTAEGQYSNYRLKIVNKDNSITYSKIIAFKAKGTENATNLALLQNPITSSISFTYAAPVNEVYTATLYTTTGVKVLSKQMLFQKGINTTQISINTNLASGNYILEVAGSTGRSTIKVAK